MTERTKNCGFTLIELMIVVAVLGVLAAVAIASYDAYIRRSRNAEATAMLADIRLKQEAYRGTFHQYMGDIPTECAGKWTPNVTPGRDPVDPSDTTKVTTACKTAWRKLGISFPKELYFVYDTAAGAPGVTPSKTRYRGANYSNDFWYGAAAIQDLDEDKDDKCGGFIVVSGNNEIMEIRPETNDTCTY